MIDKIKAEKEFKQYVAPYDVTNSKIAMKIAHTYRTAEVAKQIAESLNLNEENIELAWIIGLLHDIGRFEQLRIYDTFNDRESIDHADFGAKLLYEDGLIKQFISDRKYDALIYKAIKNHNKLDIEEGLNEEELLHAKIIRDADKTDIYEVHVKDVEEKNAVLYHEEKIKTEVVSEAVLQSFLAHHSVDKKDVKNEIDNFLVTISFIYNYYFKKGIEIIKEKQYLPRMFQLIEGCEETKAQTELIEKTALEYLEERLK